WISGSVNTSASSVLVDENSDTTAPRSPDWNQCSVSGDSVYCSPGFRTTSCQTLYVSSRPAGGRECRGSVGSPETYRYTSPQRQRKVSSFPGRPPTVGCR